ncbi:hypothetical protein M513_00723 [Trichuris suis]|uniref:Succinate dehydrogenase assembly factor 2, mitochondrial n=1 Tax=Trichuris suis TaxID=68888 RepID=A0A085MMQ1_9BILA|nr:hypothetical protein M513_00723 [Trichuris suis]
MHSKILSAIPRLVNLTSWRSCAQFTIPTRKAVPKDETLEVKRARLLYQSKKRGILENGILLGNFFSAYGSQLSPDQLATYDDLVNGGYPEWDLYYWICGLRPVPEEIKSDVLQMITVFVQGFRKKM